MAGVESRCTILISVIGCCNVATPNSQEKVRCVKFGKGLKV